MYLFRARVGMALKHKPTAKLASKAGTACRVFCKFLFNTVKNILFSPFPLKPYSISGTCKKADKTIIIWLPAQETPPQQKIKWNLTIKKNVKISSFKY